MKSNCCSLIVQQCTSISVMHLSVKITFYFIVLFYISYALLIRDTEINQSINQSINQKIVQNSHILMSSASVVHKSYWLSLNNLCVYKDA